MDQESVVHSPPPITNAHRFLGAIRDGSLPAEVFAVWLSQDYHLSLIWIQVSLLAQVPRAAQAMIANRLVALGAELTSFEFRAVERQIDLAAPSHPVTQRYRELLEALDQTSYFEVVVSSLQFVGRS